MRGPERIADFAGTWHLRRRIDDALAGQHITGCGRAAVVTDGAGGLIWDETLELHWPGQAPITGVRRYLWQPQVGAIAVRFADGRAFHRIGLGRARVTATHDCAPDRYQVEYDFSAWPQWSVRWLVRGPRKDYRMLTRAVPAGGSD